MTIAPGGGGPEPDAVRPDLSSAGSRASLVAIYYVLASQGYTFSINGIAAPFIARSFGLDDGGIAALYAFIAPAALGVLLLSRLADGLGRRRVLLACLTLTPVCALAAATATNVIAFALFDLVLYAAVGGSVSSAVVMLSEALPVHLRPRGQAYGGLASALGAGFCLIAVPWLAAGGHSWRWLLVVSGAGILTLPMLAWAIPESRRWESAAASGATRTGGLLAVLRPGHRSRALPIAVCALLSTMAVESTHGWAYYRVVSGAGLSPAIASVVVLVGGGLGLSGFRVGAWGCQRGGRVPTVVTAWLLASLGGLAFYWGPPPGFGQPALWLAAFYLWLAMASNAALVGVRTASTELFPTRLRGTIMGWSTLLGALGGVLSQLCIAALARPMGGLPVVVGYLSLLAVPSAIIFGLFVDETRGLPLDAASGS